MGAQCSGGCVPRLVASRVRPATVGLGIGSATALVVLVVFACAACAAESSGTPVSTRSEAVGLASAYTGLSEETAAAARREVTDASAPVFEVRERAVWEVVFEGVRISGPDREGEERENPNIDTVSVWIDAQTGALVKAFTPKPAEGGLTIGAGDRERARLLGNGLFLGETSALPGKPLIPVLAFAKARMRGCVPEAKEIVAYYGLLTDELDIERKWVDRPAWVIYLGGISQPFPSAGPYGSPPPPPATQALVVLDAATGEWHAAFLDG